MTARVGHPLLPAGENPVKTGKSRQKPTKIVGKCIKTKEKCGKRGFLVDIAPLKVAL
jgi:hypothetical protein